MNHTFEIVQRGSSYFFFSTAADNAGGVLAVAPHMSWADAQHRLSHTLEIELQPSSTHLTSHMFACPVGGVLAAVLLLAWAAYHDSQWEGALWKRGPHRLYRRGRHFTVDVPPSVER